MRQAIDTCKKEKWNMRRKKNLSLNIFPIGRLVAVLLIFIGFAQTGFGLKPAEGVYPNKIQDGDQTPEPTTDIESSITGQHVKILSGAIISSPTANGSQIKKYLVMHFQIDPGWHINWINPGKTGLPSEVSITLSEYEGGFKTHWPKPQLLSITSDDSSVAYGYTGRITIAYELDKSIEESTDSSGLRELYYELNYLACSDTLCKPGIVTWQDKVSPQDEREGANKFSEIPLPSFVHRPILGAKAIQVSTKANKIFLSIDKNSLVEGAASMPKVPLSDQDPYFFPETIGVIKPTIKQKASWEGSTLTIELIHTGKLLPDILQGILSFDDEREFLVHLDLKSMSSSIQPDATIGEKDASLSHIEGAGIVIALALLATLLNLGIWGMLGLQNLQSSPQNLGKPLQKLTFISVVSFFAILNITLTLLLHESYAFPFVFKHPWAAAMTILIFLISLLEYLGFADIRRSFLAEPNIVLTKMQNAYFQWVKDFFWLSSLVLLVYLNFHLILRAADFLAISQVNIVKNAPMLTAITVPIVGLLTCLAMKKVICKIHFQFSKWLCLAFVIAHVFLFGLLEIAGDESMNSFYWHAVFPILITASLLFSYMVHKLLRDRDFKQIYYIIIIGLGLTAAHVSQIPFQNQVKMFDIWLQKYSAQKLDDLMTMKKPFFINFRASWCASCPIFDARIFGSEEFKQFIGKHDIALLDADFTFFDDEIKDALVKFESNSLPFLVFSNGTEVTTFNGSATIDSVMEDATAAMAKQYQKPASEPQEP